MDNFLELLKSDAFLIIVLLISIISIILLIVNYVKLNRINKNYSEFMKKVGNGKNIDETLKSYMEDVQKVDKLNKEILNYCENLDKTVDNCIQKIGLLRYNAFKDVGSNLSFALAILNNKNDGVVLNGIYSRDMSNIYAKPIVNGTSEYALSDEEKEAIKKAISEENK